jgi:hypothetical protein
MQLNFLMVQLTHLNLNLAKQLSYISLYGLIFFNHKVRKVLRQAQDNSTEVHKVNSN